jgi:hypothetical protein
MRVCLWGTRGSIASAGPDTVAYGGNTSCVEVEAATARSSSSTPAPACAGWRHVPRAAAAGHPADPPAHGPHPGAGLLRPFFATTSRSIWGPPSTTRGPAHAADALPLAAALPGPAARRGGAAGAARRADRQFAIGGLEVCARASSTRADARLPDQRRPGTVAYLPDHEPALGVHDGPDRCPLDVRPRPGARRRPADPRRQYTADEYADAAGWGHSPVDDAVSLARLAGARGWSPSTTIRPTTTPSSTRCSAGRAAAPAGPGGRARPRRRRSACSARQRHAGRSARA